MCSKIQVRHKYKAKRTACFQGHNHPSKGEAIHCNKLELRRRSGEFEKYDYEKTYPIHVNGVLICKHKPDFTVYGENGKVWVEEFKGVLTADFKLKKKLFEVTYPQIEYKVIKA